MSKLRFITSADGSTVTIRARRKDTGAWADFGTCHPATVALIKRNGIKAHIGLVRIA